MGPISLPHSSLHPAELRLPAVCIHNQGMKRSRLLMHNCLGMPWLVAIFDVYTLAMHQNSPDFSHLKLSHALTKTDARPKSTNSIGKDLSLGQHGLTTRDGCRALAINCSEHHFLIVSYRNDQVLEVHAAVRGSRQRTPGYDANTQNNHQRINSSNPMKSYQVAIGASLEYPPGKVTSWNCGHVSRQLRCGISREQPSTVTLSKGCGFPA